MIKVIIADDERLSLNALTKAVPWETMGLTLVGTARNGIDLLEEIRKKQPDIVITDICMPGMDGLEVIGKALEEGMAVKYIIISAYTNFDYARQAIKLGVEDFLPKPILDQDLRETLERVSEKLDKAVLQKNTCSAVIQNAIDYMEKHYQKKLSLEEVAENCYISPNYLSSLFSKEKNIRFSEYLIEIRLHHAVELLEDMKYSVAEIGQMVGYRDVGYFTQIFVKKYGITPAKYRKAK